jgi:uncharacterized damage-inducible protein DinB
MVVEALINLFTRDLGKLRNEMALYKNHDRIWYHEKAITNPAGNLCLHLVGNLKTYIGAGIGKTNYVRNRELEFSAKNIPVSILLAEIDETITIVQTALSRLKESDMDNEFPVLIWDQPTTMSYTLLHLLSHLNYHLGQVNYHRRLLDN